MTDKESSGKGRGVAYPDASWIWAAKTIRHRTVHAFKPETFQGKLYYKSACGLVRLRSLYTVQHPYNRCQRCDG